MRFSARSIASKLWPRHPKKKILGAITSNGKLLVTGLAFGGGMELAGHISGKAQASEAASEGAQIINLQDYGPAFAKFDSVNSSTPHWWSQNRHIFGIPTFIFAILLLIIGLFCYRRVMCLLNCCMPCLPCFRRSNKDSDHHLDSSPSSPPREMEAIDMEDAMMKLDHDSMDPHHKDRSHYIDQSEHVQNTMKAISQSAAVRAKAALDLQSSE